MKARDIINNWDAEYVFHDWYAVEVINTEGEREYLFVGTKDEAILDVNRRIYDRIYYYNAVFYNVTLLPEEEAKSYFESAAREEMPEMQSMREFMNDFFDYMDDLGVGVLKGVM